MKDDNEAVILRGSETILSQLGWNDYKELPK
jgi:hypothetical protein